mgnify:CR=1 FL=1
MQQAAEMIAVESGVGFLILHAGNIMATTKLMVGIVVGTVSTIFVACPLLLWLGTSKQDLMPKSRDEAELARRP